MRSALLAAVTLLNVAAAIAQPRPNFPDRSIRVVVPFAPGGTADILARTVIEQANRDRAGSFHIENLTGAGGVVGSTAVVRSAADGYTLLVCNLSCASNQFLNPNLGWTPSKNLTPVGVLGTVPNILVINPQVPANNLVEFIALAKREPDRLSLASSGPGSSSQLTGELFQSRAKIRLLDVPYRGSAAAMADILAGRVTGMMMGLPESIPFVRSSKLRALGLAAIKRAMALPDVPTLAQAGLPEFRFNGWISLFAPAGTAPEAVARINDMLNRALQSERVQKRFAESDIEPVGGTPELAGRLMEEDVKIWGDLIRSRAAAK